MINQIDIQKSIEAEKLISKEAFLRNIASYILGFMIALILPFIAIMEFNSDLTRNKPMVFSSVFLILSFILAASLIYSILNLNSLKRIKGVSRGKNSAVIKKIAEGNNWNVYSSNQQITIINFDWRNSGGMDWGKQLTILYDKTDILVNCISFGLYSSPSPFHWYANRRKINVLKNEFLRKIEL